MVKRLFLFAGYDKTHCVDNSLIYTIRKLSQLGDVIAYLDCDAAASELEKLSPYVLYAGASKHGEYDFGSYRRAYTYARDAAILNNYDYLYLVNDSVYGPLFDLAPLLETMESYNVDAFGPVSKLHKRRPHIQSWFVGCDRTVFKSDWFEEFMTSITKQPDKGEITYRYEQGFTKLITEHNMSWRTFLTVKNRGVYNDVKKLFKRGLPFIKKSSLHRHGGALGRQILYVLNHTSPDVHDAILENARRTWGDEYICWLLTKNPFKIIYRNLQYALHKFL